MLPRLLICAALASTPAAPAAVLAQPAEPLRLTGLERLHFEPFDPEQIQGRCARELGLELAAELGSGPAPEHGAHRDPAPIDEFPCELGVSRHRLSLGGAVADSDAMLVEVVDWTNLRSKDTHWCLYANGRRTSCWRYNPHSESTRGKALANLTVHGVRAEGVVVLELLGSMARPQGAFWEYRTDLFLKLEGTALRPDYLVRRYLVGRPHERVVGDEDDWEIVSPPPYAATETLESRAGVVVAVERRVDEVSDADLERCGRPDGEFLLATDEMERLARCLVKSRDALVRERRLDEPTFIERDWMPSERRTDPPAPR